MCTLQPYRTTLKTVNKQSNKDTLVGLTVMGNVITPLQQSFEDYDHSKEIGLNLLPLAQQAHDSVCVLGMGHNLQEGQVFF